MPNGVVKIGVVGYEMEGDRSGVGRFLEGVLGGIRELDQPWEWLLFFKGGAFDHPLWQAPPGKGAKLRPIFDGRPEAKPILWEQTRLPDLLRAAELDLVFSPAYSLPPRLDQPGLLTLHDLSFEHRPQEFGFKERWRRRLLARWGARKACRVLTTSSATYQDLKRTYGLHDARLGLLPMAVDDRFAAAADGPVDPAAGLRPAGPYLLWLATILPRRRLDWVIEAFAQVAPERPELKLLIGGANRLPEPAQLDAWIAASGVAERIVRLDYVPEEAVPGLYAGAELSFYVSSFEGFGLPPLESLAAGTPCVVSAGLELDDLWPEYPLRAEDAAAVLARTRTALAELDRAAFFAEARRRVGHLSWRHCAQRLIEEIARCLPVQAGQPTEAELFRGVE